MRDNPWRSRKYAQLSDEEIIALSLQSLSHRDRWFLMEEIDTRGLNQQAVEAQSAETKRSLFNKPWWKFIPLVVGLLFLLKHLLGNF